MQKLAQHLFLLNNPNSFYYYGKEKQKKYQIFDRILLFRSPSILI